MADVPYRLRVIRSPELEPGFEAKLRSFLNEMGPVVLPPGCKVEYIQPPPSFDMLLAADECADCQVPLARGDLVWQRPAGPWWRFPHRSRAWFYVEVPGAVVYVCGACAREQLLPSQGTQERERRERLCREARAAWLDPDGPEVRCECGHLVEQHCLDDEHCTWDEDVHLGGRCLAADCDCYVCRPASPRESVFDFVERQMAKRGWECHAQAADLLYPPPNPEIGSNGGRS